MLFCRRSLHPRPSRKSEKKRPSFYTNPIAPHSSIRSGQVIIALEELQDGAVPEGDYEEPEDEVQEVGGELSVGNLSNDFSASDERQPDVDFSHSSPGRDFAEQILGQIIFASFLFVLFFL